MVVRQTSISCDLFVDGSSFLAKLFYYIYLFIYTLFIVDKQTIQCIQLNVYN